MMASTPPADLVNVEQSTSSTLTTTTDSLLKDFDYTTEQWDPTQADPQEKEELPPQHAKRINKDLRLFFTDPIPDIMLCPDSNNVLIAHAIIVGPEDTPYEGGFFYFYIKFPYDYPFSPPMIKLMTTGQNTVRFNPNLYSNGKVCLSILNTWSGPKWSAAGNLSSVLVSIQSIMNENPLHNEPGLSSFLDFSTNSVKLYNEMIRHETIRVAVIDMVEDNFDSRNMPTVLKEYIREYFKTKISYYNRVISASIHLDGQPMNDIYNERSEQFNFQSLKLKMDKLKEKHLLDQ